MAAKKKAASKKAAKKKAADWMNVDIEPAEDHDCDGVNSVAAAPKPKRASKGRNVVCEYESPGAAAEGCKVVKFDDNTKEIVPK
jgi:hypothetical protein